MAKTVLCCSPDFWSNRIPGPIFQKYPVGAFGELVALLIVFGQRDAGVSESRGRIGEQEVAAVFYVVAVSAETGGDDWTFSAERLGDFDPGSSAVANEDDYSTRQY